MKHVAKMFELAGDTAEKAAANAKTVMRIETALAKVDARQREPPHAGQGLSPDEAGGARRR